MAYLIGIREDSLYEGDKHLSCYKRLSVDKNARIIRNLSRARTIIWRNYKELESRSKAGTGLYSANDIMPMALIKELDSDSVSFCSTIPWEHIIEINRLIHERMPGMSSPGTVPEKTRSVS